MNMKNKMKKTGVLAIFLSVLLVVGVMAGCNSSQTILEQNQTVGSLLIRVNPEIKVSYDADGQIMSIEGKNSEGQQIVDQMADFSKKPVKEIVKELVTLIHNSGYLVEEIDGDRRNIVIEIESGSQIPSDDFLEQIVIDVERLLKMRNFDSEIQVNASDYDAESSATATTARQSDDQAETWPTTASPNNSDYSDYSDYGDSDYDDGSKQAERTTRTTQSTVASQNLAESSDYSDYADSDYDDSDYRDDSDYDDSDYDDSDYDDDTDYDDSDYDDSDYDDDSDYSDYSD